MYIRKYTNIDPTGFVMVFVTSFEYVKTEGVFKSWLVTRDRWAFFLEVAKLNWGQELRGKGDVTSQLWKHQNTHHKSS